jgi:hypothetical protein
VVWHGAASRYTSDLKAGVFLAQASADPLEPERGPKQIASRGAQLLEVAQVVRPRVKVRREAELGAGVLHAADRIDPFSLHSGGLVAIAGARSS